eukprot:8237232-Heterocapsa_arctica.AAC.1
MASRRSPGWCIDETELLSDNIALCNAFEALALSSVSSDDDCGLEQIVVKQELVSRSPASPRQCALLSSNTWSSPAVLG